MRHVRMLGLWLVAAFALAAMAAASASAATQPEFRVCAKPTTKLLVKYKSESLTHVITEKSKSVYDYKYSNSSCTTLAPSPGTWDKESLSPLPNKYDLSYEGPEGKYEWEEVKAPDAFIGKTAKGTFYYYNETTKKIVWEVACTADKNTGEITSATELTWTLTFEKCTATKEATKAKTACAGTIAANPSFTTLAETYPGEEAGIAVIEFTSHFSCGATEFTAQNGFGIGKAENNSAAPKAVYAVNKATGEQKITGLVFGGETYSPEHLASVVGGEALGVGVETTQAIGPKGVYVVG